MRRARGSARHPLYAVSAWAARQRLVPGHEVTEEKSNEIRAIPLLRARLHLTGALLTIAARTRHEIVPAIVGGLFVVEALSVIIQVLYFKRTGKRVVLMAPIHHHFAKKGWAEPQIVIRFRIISLILALIGPATLKVR